MKLELIEKLLSCAFRSYCSSLERIFFSIKNKQQNKNNEVFNTGTNILKSSTTNKLRKTSSLKINPSLKINITP